MPEGYYWEHCIYLCLTSWLFGRLKISLNPWGACLECPAALSRAVLQAVSLCCSGLQVVSTSLASRLCRQAQLRTNTEQASPPLPRGAFPLEWSHVLLCAGTLMGSIHWVWGSGSSDVRLGCQCLYFVMVSSNLTRGICSCSHHCWQRSWGPGQVSSSKYPL